MKKTYTKPLFKLRCICFSEPLAGVSGQLDDNTIISGGDEGGDPGGALIKQHDLWEDDEEEYN